MRSIAKLTPPKTIETNNYTETNPCSKSPGQHRNDFTPQPMARPRSAGMYSLAPAGPFMGNFTSTSENGIAVLAS
jgi:hypothetical protein